MKNRYLLHIILFLYLLGLCISPVVQGDVKTYTKTVGETFDVEFHLNPKWFFKGFEFKVRFDPMYLTVNEVKTGDVFAGHTMMFGPGVIDNSNGTIVNIYGLIVNATENESEPGSLAVISFTAKDVVGITSILMYDYLIVNETGAIPMESSNGSIQIAIVEKESIPEEPPVEEPPVEEPPMNTSHQSDAQPEIKAEGIQIMDFIIPIIIGIIIVAIIVIRLFFW